MTFKKSFRDRYAGVSFNLALARQVAFGLLILSVLLPSLYIVYEDFTNRYQLETFMWYTSLMYRRESRFIPLEYSARWSIVWFALPAVAFPFVLMYFGMKKKHMFDVGIALFALFLGIMILPPLMTPASAIGWDSVKPELLVGSYLAIFVLVAYAVARPLLPWETTRLEADRLPPHENVDQSAFAVRSLILVFALLSFILPFAVEYSINSFFDNQLLFNTVSYWYGNIGVYPIPFNILFLPVVYLPLIMMWLGLKHSGLFTKGVALFTVYWIWHLLFFTQAQTDFTPDSIHFTVPAVGLAFFLAVVVVYAFMFLNANQRASQLWQKVSVTEGKPESKSFFKKCINCGRDIPLASEQCPYCQAKQP